MRNDTTTFFCLAGFNNRKALTSQTRYGPVLEDASLDLVSTLEVIFGATRLCFCFIFSNNFYEPGRTVPCIVEHKSEPLNAIERKHQP